MVYWGSIVIDQNTFSAISLYESLRIANDFVVTENPPCFVGTLDPETNLRKFKCQGNRLGIVYTGISVGAEMRIIERNFGERVESIRERIQKYCLKNKLTLQGHVYEVVDCVRDVLGELEGKYDLLGWDEKRYNQLSDKMYSRRMMQYDLDK